MCHAPLLLISFLFSNFAMTGWEGATPFMGVSQKKTLFASQVIAFGQPKESNVAWLSPTAHDFGELKQGKPVTHVFRFKNTGNTPLLIDNVRASCGCTGVDWLEEIVPPGGEGTVKIEFDAKKPGYFYKKITVFFSSQRKGEKLFIEGYVE